MTNNCPSCGKFFYREENKNFYWHVQAHNVQLQYELLTLQLSLAKKQVEAYDSRDSEISNKKKTGSETSAGTSDTGGSLRLGSNTTAKSK